MARDAGVLRVERGIGRAALADHRAIALLRCGHPFLDGVEERAGAWTSNGNQDANRLVVGNSAVGHRHLQDVADDVAVFRFVLLEGLVHEDGADISVELEIGADPERRRGILAAGGDLGRDVARPVGVAVSVGDGAEQFERLLVPAAVGGGDAGQERRGGGVDKAGAERVVEQLPVAGASQTLTAASAEIGLIAFARSSARSRAESRPRQWSIIAS